MIMSLPASAPRRPALVQVDRSHEEESQEPTLAWGVEEVQAWAQKIARLAPKTCAVLQEQKVDGATLLSLTKADLREELGLRSLPARKHLWDQIETLRQEVDVQDWHTAVQFHEQEIARLVEEPQREARQERSPSLGAADAASGGVALESSLTAGAQAMDATVIQVLREDAATQRQVLADHLIALKMQNGSNHQVYEDYDMARREQERLDQLAVRCDLDRQYALSLADPATARSLERSSDETLFGRCIDACVRNRINVSEALSMGQAEALKQWRERGLRAMSAVVTDDDGDEIEDEDGDENENGDEDEDDAESGNGRGEMKMTPRVAMDGRQIQRQVKVAPTFSSRGSERAGDKAKSDKSKFLSLPIIDVCSTCYDEGKRGFFLACEHCYCADCMRQLLRTALRDSSLLPLRCCELPMETPTIAEYVLKPEEADLLETRTLEVTATNKMYCPSCNRFLNLDSIAEMVTHCVCSQAVCTTCKTAAHPGITCARNQSGSTPADEALYELARSEGWKQCPGCQSMIELRSGCNHMSCSRCRHEFCFRCLNPWNTNNGTCSTQECEVWDEDRLLEAAEARVNNAPRPRDAPPMQAEVFAQRVRVEMNALRGNEGCLHQWSRRNGYQGSCERCGFSLHVYGMVCQGGCRSRVCYTCAHHRIPRWGWR